MNLIYVLVFLIAIHVFWLSLVVDVDRKVLVTFVIIFVSMAIYMIYPDLFKVGLMINVVFAIAGLVSIYYLKEGN